MADAEKLQIELDRHYYIRLAFDSPKEGTKNNRKWYMWGVEEWNGRDWVAKNWFPTERLVELINNHDLRKGSELMLKKISTENGTFIKVARRDGENWLELHESGLKQAYAPEVSPGGAPVVPPQKEELILSRVLTGIMRSVNIACEETETELDPADKQKLISTCYIDFSKRHNIVLSVETELPEDDDAEDEGEFDGSVGVPPKGVTDGDPDDDLPF